MRSRVPAVLRLYGCAIDPEDADHFVEALRSDGSYASLEAAEAVRWGAAAKIDATEIEAELRDALLHVLDGRTPGLAALRDALTAAATEEPKAPHRRRLVERLHNPRQRQCGCLGDC